MNRPNILLIMSDQHHAGIMGCAGDAVADTPHLDALAARGGRFTNCYCPYPLCGPSRMSFMTGQQPQRLGIWDNSQELASHVPTFAHACHAGGYQTVLSGRMHFVGHDQRHGFAERLVGDGPESAFIGAGWKLKRVLGELSDTTGMSRTGIRKSGPGRSGYLAYDQTVTAATTEWLQRRQDDRPFLLTVGYIAPHCPFVCPEEDFAYFAERIGLDDLPPWNEHLHPINETRRRKFQTDPELPALDRWRARVAYYGLCRFLDRQIGEVLAGLKASGEAENTVVIYTSDHGEMLGEHGMWWKSCFYDGAARVPLLVAGPGCASGLVYEDPVGLIDLADTVCGLAGCERLPASQGHSLLAACGGEERPPQDVFCENVFMYDEAVGRMLRRGAWKYCHHHGQAPELFNLDEDPHERHDRAADPACAGILAELQAACLADWDPEAIHQRMQQRRAEAPLISCWLRDNPPPEPDPLWFDDDPINHFDTSPTPSDPPR